MSTFRQPAHLAFEVTDQVAVVQQHDVGSIPAGPGLRRLPDQPAQRVQVAGRVIVVAHPAQEVLPLLGRSGRPHAFAGEGFRIADEGAEHVPAQVCRLVA